MEKSAPIIKKSSYRSWLCKKIWKNNQTNNGKVFLMKKSSHPITFIIDKENSIIIPLEDPISYLGPIYEESIFLSNNNHKIILSNRTIYHDMLDLADILKKALDTKLLLHPSITKDIGYLYNHHHYNDTNSTMH